MMTQNFKRRSVNNIALFLKSVGVNVHQKKIRLSNLYQFGAIFPTSCALIFLMLYIFKNRNQMHDVMIVAAYMQGTITMLASICIFLHNRHKILEIFQMMDENIYKYPDEENIPVKFPKLLEEKNFGKILLLIVGYECIGFSLGIISPLFAYLLTGKHEGRMYPAWYPWGEEGMISSTINNILQLSGCLGAFWIFFVAQALITFITIEFSRQSHRLQKALSSIQYRSNNILVRKMNRNADKRGKVFRQRYNDIYRENLSHCIKHYQQMWKLFHLFQPWFSVFYSTELSLSAATLALVFYNLLTAWNPQMLLTIIGSAFNVIANLFSRCIIGEVFADMNRKITNTIFYEISWWEQSNRNRNLLLLLHKMSLRSYTLKGCTIYTASYYTFSQLTRMSYSYVNIIRSTLAKT